MVGKMSLWLKMSWIDDYWNRQILLMKVRRADELRGFDESGKAVNRVVCKGQGKIRQVDEVIYTSSELVREGAGGVRICKGVS